MSELTQLAERLIRAEAELDTVRAAMKRLLLNGSAHEPIRPTRPPGQVRGARPRTSKGSARRHPNATRAAKAVEAAKAEARIVELVKTTPGMGTAAIARATGAGTTTAAGRLKRLEARHLIERGDEGWRASAEGSRPNEARTSPTD